MIFVTYNADNGSLVNIGGDSLPAPNPAHCTRAIDAQAVDVATWNPLTLRFDDEMRQSVILTKLEYLRRFTGQERVTIRGVAKTNPVLEDYLAMLDIAEEINLSDADTVNAVHMLEQAGLIADGRAAEILS